MAYLKMLPLPTADNRSCRTSRYSELGCEFGHSYLSSIAVWLMTCARWCHVGQATQFPRLRIAQLSSRMPFPFIRTLSLTFDHLTHIFFVGAREKVSWINTSWIIAGVKNVRARRYRSIVQPVRKAMSRHLENAIAMFVPGAFPRPTIIRPFQFAEESVYDILRKGLVIQGSTPLWDGVL